MKTTFTLFILLIWPAAAVAGQPGVTTAATTKSYSEMYFRIFTPCNGNGGYCAPTILAKGVITNSTAEKLEQFVISQRNAGKLTSYVRVCFDSPGGSLLGGIRVGQTIRRMRLITCIEPEYSVEERDGLRDIERDVICASSCVLAFSGGVHRLVQPGARVGIHQFSSQSGQIGDSSTQVAIVTLSQYLQKMGVRRDLLDAASLVAPEKIYWLSSDQLIKFSLETTSVRLEPWQLDATQEGLIFATVTQPRNNSANANVTQLILYQENGNVYLHVRGLFRDQFSSNALEGARTLNHEGGIGVSLLRLIIDDDHNAVSRHVRWKVASGAGGVETAIKLSRADSIRIANAQRLMVDVDCPHSVSHFELSTPISVEGLGKAVRALLR